MSAGFLASRLPFIPKGGAQGITGGAAGAGSMAHDVAAGSGAFFFREGDIVINSSGWKEDAWSDSGGYEVKHTVVARDGKIISDAL